VLEQKINLINEDKGILTLCTVLCDTVQDRVKDNKHTNRHKLFTQVKNVIADKAVIGIHIRLLCKGIQRTVCEKFNGKCQFLCFRFVLLQKFCPEILQGRYMSLIIILLITAVHACRATVNDRLLLCSEICSADKLFTKGHNKLGFQNDRVCTIAVILIHIHCIDVIVGSSRNIDYFSAHRIDKL